ncbi:lipoprotein-releasing system ATP-binding protein LolD, partial [Vibrio parahaemolyticus]|nr:lipoprotein-releasing system ATP-binding protein LolD [Vibrio parahaemolyticus]
VVTHDKELAAKMDRQMHMQDGLLVDRFVTDTASAEG